MIKNVLRSAVFVIIGLVVCITPSVSALTQTNIDSMADSRWAYDPSTECASLTLANTGISGEGVWNSGLQPPYIMEQFMIETLKDIAKKRGVSEDKTVTEEHVIALVAFGFGEGGDINNQDLFNIFNTGINAPDLLATEHSVSGVQSFKSFDAGVEATARTMVGNTQSRLADILIDPNSTADQFMKTLTYYKDYQGNKAWAAASEEPHADNYFRQRLQLVQQVRKNYANIAGLVIGTPAKEFQTNLRDTSKLKYHPAGSAPATNSTNVINADYNPDCSNSSSTPGVGSAAIVQTAEREAWNDGRRTHTARQEYYDDHNKYNSGTPSNPDCGIFVATVIRASGADPSYPGINTESQFAYLKNQNGKKYDFVQLNSSNSTKDLMPGDILIIPGVSGIYGGNGHTFLYIGPHGKFDGAGASLNSYMPTFINVQTKDARGYYWRARLK